AEVEDESELLGAWFALVLKDHPAVGVELALVDVLAADEGEVDRTGVVGGRRGDGAADATTVPLSVVEAIPIDARRLEPADEHARGPIGSRRHRRPSRRDDAAEGLVFGDFERQHVAVALNERPPGPENHAAVVWIA